MNWFEPFIVVAALAGIAATLRCARANRRMRSAVLDAAHELARPLAAIGMAVEASRSGADCRAAVLPELVRARTALSDLHAIGGDPVACKPERFDLGELAAEVAGSWSPAARAIGRSLAVEQSGATPVEGDRPRIGQALAGLVANSLEHGSGQILIGVRPDGGSCVIEVADGGQSGTAASRDRGPARGRGLRIASRAVRDSGGMLRGSFSPAGSSVRLTLPSGGGEP